MQRTIAILLILAVQSGAALAKDEPQGPPVGLSSSRQLTHDKGESWTYFNPKLDLRKYRDLIIEPTVVYDGPDARFEDVDPADKDKFAGIVDEGLRTELAKGFTIVSRPDPGTARIRVTVLGVDNTTGGVATVTRVTPFGFALNAVKSMADKPGSFTGSVLYAVELNDGVTGELQVAAVRRESPDALDVGATLSTTDTVKSVANRIGKQIREKLEKASGRTP